VFGGHTVWHSEIDPAASKVLAHRWPGVLNLGDITKVAFDIAPPVDILCGGWPCQPFSQAGRRKGIEDDRALWPYVAGAVRLLRPHIVVLENVSAVLTAGEFQRVADDLAEIGYDFAWTCARASDVGAPHRRERIFIVATDVDVARIFALKPVKELMHDDRPRQIKLLSTPQARDYKGVPSDGFNQANLCRDVANVTEWDKYAPAIYRWRCVTNRVAPPPTEPNKNGNPRLSAAFSEWMMGWPDGWVTDPAIGISRNDQLRIIGNGVCSQQCVAALRHLLNVAALTA